MFTMTVPVYKIVAAFCYLFAGGLIAGYDETYNIEDVRFFVGLFLVVGTLFLYLA